VKESNPLFDAAHALMLLVEGPGCLRWEDGNGSRLKDTSQWAAFYCAVKAAPPAVPVESLGRDAEPDEVAEYVDDYEYRGETEDGRDACYTPNERERILIEDAIRGWEDRTTSAEPVASVPDGSAILQAIDALQEFKPHAQKHPHARKGFVNSMRKKAATCEDDEYGWINKGDALMAIARVLVTTTPRTNQEGAAP